MSKFFEDMIDNSSNDAVTLLDTLFREFHEVESKEPSKYISPSSLNCAVACAFKLQGMPVDPVKESFQSRQFAEHGTDRHERIQAFLSETPYWVDVAEYVKNKDLPLTVLAEQGHEVLLVSEEYRARFKCDGMLLINGEYYILEIKTERSSANARRTEPDKKHYMQGVAYALLLDVNKIMWLYEGRDQLEQKLFVQEVTSQEKERVSSYIKNILANVDAPENLPRNEAACRYCPYKKYCTMFFKELKRKEMEALWLEQNSQNR